MRKTKLYVLSLVSDKFVLLLVLLLLLAFFFSPHRWDRWDFFFFPALFDFVTTLIGVIDTGLKN
jgi:hypothetical protein